MSIKKEALWVFASTGISASSQLIVLLLLANTENATVLGELSIINIVLALAFLLQDMGLSSYFIHRQNLSKAEKSSLFAINLALGATATFIVLILSQPIGNFYQSDNIRDGLVVVAFNFIFIGMTAQYQAHFIKEFKNEILAKIDILTKVTMILSTSYFLYYENMGVFSYLYALLIASIMKLILILCTVPSSWHPILSFDKKIIKSALGFGSYQMGSQIINQMRTQLDQLIIGKWLGMEILGVYSIAKELVMQPTKLIAPLTSKLVLPRLAKAQKSVEQTKELFNRASKIILFVNSLVYTCLTVVLYFAIPAFFGEKYILSFHIYTLLLLIGLLRPIGSLFGALCQANGVTNIEFKWNLLSSVLAVLALILALPFHSIEAFALAMAGVQLLLSLYAAFYFSNHLICINKEHHMRRVGALTCIYLIIHLFFYSLR